MGDIAALRARLLLRGYGQLAEPAEHSAPARATALVDDGAAAADDVAVSGPAAGQLRRAPPRRVEAAEKGAVAGSGVAGGRAAAAATAGRSPPRARAPAAAAAAAGALPARRVSARERLRRFEEAERLFVEQDGALGKVVSALTRGAPGNEAAAAAPGPCMAWLPLSPSKQRRGAAEQYRKNCLQPRGLLEDRELVAELAALEPLDFHRQRERRPGGRARGAAADAQPYATGPAAMSEWRRWRHAQVVAEREARASRECTFEPSIGSLRQTLELFETVCT